MAVEKYEERSGTTTSECGLFISIATPMLAASPDRIVDGDTLLEVKCPFAARDKLINETSVPYMKNVHGALQLDRKHAYFYQVQGQLYCADKKLCHFVVYTNKDMKVVHVMRDDTFYSQHGGKVIRFLQQILSCGSCQQIHV